MSFDIGYCADCKWWDKIKPLDSDPPSVKAGIGYCGAVSHVDSYRNHTSLASTYADYSSSLLTSAKFGCMQYEPMEEKR